MENSGAALLIFLSSGKIRRERIFAQARRVWSRDAPNNDGGGATAPLLCESNSRSTIQRIIFRNLIESIQRFIEVFAGGQLVRVDAASFHQRQVVAVGVQGADFAGEV